MKAVLRIACLAVLSLGFLMCSKSGDGSSTKAPKVTIKTTLVTSDGGQQFISIEADGAWKLSSPADWVQFNPESGVGSAAAVVLSYEANETPSFRTATIIATVGNKSGSSVLSQSGQGQEPSVIPHIEPEESSYTVGAAGGTLEIRLNTNVKYTSTVSQAAASWIHVSTSQANIFTIDEYTGDSSRTGTITFSSLDGIVSATVTVVQNASSVQPAATVTTGAADGITTASAVLSGYFSAASSAPVEAGFYWGITSQPTDAVKVPSAPSGTASEFSTSISGLSENTTYYYQAYVIVREKSGEQTFKGAVRNFTTQESVGPTPVVPGDQKGWYELPLMNISVSGDYMYNTDNPSDYYAYHICPDLYTSGNKKARNYTICFSGEHHCPLWVAAPRHSMYEGGSGRTDAYKIDPDIPADIQYKSKSAGSGSGCNRGHMLGSAERTATSQTNAQVFYLSNIAPQLSSGFNTGGGGWNTLEGWVDGQVCSDTLYVVIGTYFEQFTDGYGYTVQPKKITYAGREDVSFPTMFYYVLMRTKKGSTGKALKDCAASEIKCAAFVRAHTNSLKGQKVSSKEMMSVSALEQITGITYFQNVPNAPKSTATASDWGL